MPHYALYTMLPDGISGAITAASARIQAELGAQVAYVPDEEPHITVAFGPELAVGADEATSKSAVDAVFGGAIGLAATHNTLGAQMEFRGVSHFACSSSANVVVCVEWACKELTGLRTAITRAVPQLTEAREAEDTLRADDRFALLADRPGRWAHTTLAVLKPCANILHAEEIARDALDGTCFHGLQVQDLVAITAVTDTKIQLL